MSLTESLHAATTYYNLAKAEGDLISLNNRQAQFTASRLLNLGLRHEVWGNEDTPPSLQEVITSGIETGRYDACLSTYSAEELKFAEALMEHSLDFTYTYASMMWWMDKYLVQDRSTGRKFETPQFAMMISSLALYSEEPGDRVSHAVDLYLSVAKRVVSQPTPIRTGMRTKLRQFASCVLASMDDTLPSIVHTNLALTIYGSQRAGLGLDIGDVRAIHSTVSGGEVVSTGVIPFLKMVEASIKSTSQHGVRSASATVFFPFWHAEVESLIIAKSPVRGSFDRKVMKLDYCMGICQFLYVRAREGRNITLFSPHEVPELKAAWGTPDFERVYEAAEERTDLTFSKRLPARELLNLALEVTVETGRLYYLHMENANTHSSFIDAIKMSNLCVTGDTLVRTSSGYATMKSLWELQGKTESRIGHEEPVDRAFLVGADGLVKMSTRVVMTDQASPIVRVTLGNGAKLRVTPSHEFLTARGRIKACFLLEGDVIPLSLTYGPFGKESVTDKDVDCYVNHAHLGEDIASVLGWSSLSLADFLYRLNWKPQDGSKAVWISLPSWRSCQIVQAILSQFGIAAQVSTKKTGENLVTISDFRSLSRFVNEVGMSGSVQGLAALFNAGEVSPVESTTVVSTEFEETDEPVFCLHEPERQEAVFGGVVTGQCMEITHPTVPIQHIDGDGKIGICILSALNVTEIDENNIASIARTTVRQLDTLIDYQTYPVKAGEQFCKYWRSLGVGLTNLATWLAREGLNYEHPDTPNRVSDLMEMVQWHLLNASCDLAAERGPAPGFERTKYALGLLPIDHYKKRLDTVVTTPPKQDWEFLRKKIKKHGLRNATLTAQMPCESSSVVQDTTNGIDPPRGLVSYKKAKAGPVPVIVPDVGNDSAFQLAFDMKNNRGFLSVAAAIQKWTDMSISTNLYYSYARYPNRRLPLNIVMAEQLHFWNLGGKTLYYIVSDDGDEQSLGFERLHEKAELTQEVSGCEGGACTL